MTPKRPKVKPIRNPTLFEMGEVEDAGQLANSLQVERPYSEPGLLLGTSGFTVAGWEGSFYPAGTKPSEYFRFYATCFKTVEIEELSRPQAKVLAYFCSKKEGVLRCSDCPEQNTPAHFDY